ncbi:unnamed protein product [Rhizoctonia solani]|uniref:DUF6535 domain-containing protein n=1 Tax=Rhizoctonia solani TaxID=456999 RepID=A0A8H2XYA4_9AGAM|nr:unnamed protein product [Rhizoctonia solani]
MDATETPKPTPGPTQTDLGLPKGPIYQQMNYDKLASDRIGEELNPNATIWKLYVDEAKEYDTELASERNENLNNMLLFATLFSAIVTAFIIESTGLLEQDSSDVSAQLLLMLVQSQQRIETGVPDSSTSPVQVPEFVPSATARVINVLWFASLMISLGAAVVAILAKEWLTAYTTNRTRDAHKYALERQARLVSLDIWKMLVIIDLLPTFLNFSLFVFSLGLIIRLWLLDFIVAGVITAISAGVCVIYLFFVISGAVYDGSPYKARLSAYIRTIGQGILNRFSPKEPTDPHLQKNMQSSDDKCIGQEQAALLTWLFNRASDPMMGSYVTQALAGLKSLKIKLPTFLDQGPLELEPKYTQNSEILAPMFELGLQAIAQLQTATGKGRNELEQCGGINAARLATAIAEIYPHALSWQLCSPAEAAHARGDTFKEFAHSEVSEPTNRPTIDMISACKITDNVFDALDQLWAETSPALTLSAYAYLLAAELKMIRYALAFLNYRARNTSTGVDHTTIEMTTPFADAQPQIPRSNIDSLPKRSYTGLNQTALIIKDRSLRAFTYAMRLLGLREVANPAIQDATPAGMANTTGEYPAPPGLNQDALRGRYGYTLTITALVIKASISHVTSKGSKELQSAITALLCEATQLVEQEKPKPDDKLHRFGTKDYSDFDGATVFYAADGNTTRSITCRIYATGYELMEGLVKLCESNTDMMRSTPLLEGFRIAAFNLILTFWPTYVEQRRRDRAADYKVPGWVYPQWKTVLVERTPYTSQQSADIIVYQSTVLAHIAFQIETWEDLYDKVLPYWEHQGWKQIRQFIFKLLSSRYRELPKLTEALQNHPNIQENLYCRWLPAATELVGWISSLYEQYSTSLNLSDQDLEALHRKSWWTGYVIAIMRYLPDCQVEGHLHNDVPSQLILSHSSTQDTNMTTEHQQLPISHYMNFIYAASQAADRDDTIPVLDMLVEQAGKHIETANLDRDLKYFAHGEGFQLLEKLTLIEADRRNAVYMIWKVVIALHTAQVCVSMETLPSLLKVLCYVFDDIPTHEEFVDGLISLNKQLLQSGRRDPASVFRREQYLYMSLNKFVTGIHFQLEELLKPIQPTVLFPVQKLLSDWAHSIHVLKEKGLFLQSEEITTLQDQVQRWFRLGTSDLDNSGNTPPQTNDHEPSIRHISSMPTLCRTLSIDNPSGNTLAEDSRSDLIIPLWLFAGGTETEDTTKLVHKELDEQPTVQSEEVQVTPNVNIPGAFQQETS